MKASMSPEGEWQNRIYSAAGAKFDRDPDIDHEMVTKLMVEAALTELAAVLDEHHTKAAAAFVRRLLV